MGNLFDKLGGRKFVLTLIVLVIGGLVEVFSKSGLSANFVGLLLGSSTIFGVANAAVSMKNGGVDVSGGAEAAAAAADEAHTKVDSLATQAGEAIDAVSAEQARLRAELEVQAQGLATATKLIKALMKV